MSLSSGQNISYYEILGPLGAGGMGEVYRARDTHLGRDVAIKVLPPDLAGDEERSQRFDREAKTLATLNHPNVTQVYGIDRVEGLSFIAMELVPGEDLETRLTQGPLPLDEALDVCRQIAEGLEAAHEAGVVHRDLKPANVRITPEGLVKVLDFGLAKPLPARATATGATTADLDSFLMTEEGLVLGTPVYMSPEQARGKPVDRRTDVWAFGCVLYQCLTRTRPFEGKTVADVLVAVIEREPDWSLLPQATPGRVRELVRRCLDKNAHTRLRDIGEARIALGINSAVDPPGSATNTPRRLIEFVPLLGIGLVIALTSVVATVQLTTSTEPSNPLANARITRLTDLPGDELYADISPDGKFVAFISDRDGRYDAWLRQVSRGEPRNLSKELGGQVYSGSGVRGVGFSGDGSEVWLLLSDPPSFSQRIMSVPIVHGSARLLFEDEVAASIDWAPDGRWAYHQPSEGDPVYVSDKGGANPRLVCIGDPGIHQHVPTWSPDGEWLYMTRGHPSSGDMNLWRVRPDGRDPQQLTEGIRNVTYPTPIDARTVLFIGEEADGAGPWLWAHDLKTHTSQRVLVGLERYLSVSASADGRRLVATVANPTARLWKVPILAGKAAVEDDAKPLVLSTIRALGPRFGGDSLFFMSSRGARDGVWRREDDGSVTEIWRGTDHALSGTAAVSRDGSQVAVCVKRGDRQSVIVSNSDGTQPRALCQEINARSAGSWSPDSQWIVVAGEGPEGSGLFKIHVENSSFECIADGDANHPVWSPKGNLIIYAGPQKGPNMPLLAVTPDGESKKLPEEVEVLVLGERFRFLPDGSGLVYMKGLRLAHDFWILDLKNGGVRQLTQLEDQSEMLHFDITPDGKSIVFDRSKMQADLVLIELDAPAD